MLPERAALPLERALPEHDESAERLEVLDLLAGRHHHLVVVAPLLALVQRTLSPAQLAAGRVSLRLGERIDQRGLLTALVAGGYEAAVEVSGVGEFANRGGIVDIWPPGAAEPLRLELFGDELESMRAFDPMTQGSRRRVERATLLPASEFLPAGGWQALGARAPRLPSDALQADLARLEQGDLAEAAETWAALLTAGATVDHLPPGAHLVLTDTAELRAIATDLDRQAVERRAGLVTSGELPNDWPLPYEAAGALAELESRAAELLDEGAEADAGYVNAPLLPGRSDRLGTWLADLVASGRRLVVTTDQASRVGELLEEDGRAIAPVAELHETPPLGRHRPRARLALRRLRPRADRPAGALRPGAVRRNPGSPATPSKRAVTRDLIGKLAVGDAVVHIDHGIARYAGMTQRAYGGATKEYLQLDFAGDDKIFLPADQIGRITRYSGGPAPTLSRLGGTDWERVKSRVRRAVAELAEDLLAIYAARASAPGFSFSPDTTWQRELEEAFPYTETRDQHRTHRGGEGRHAPPPADGPPRLRRRRLRQDRGRAAGRLQGRAGRQAGRRAGADHRAGAAAPGDLPRGLRRSRCASRCCQPLRADRPSRAGSWRRPPEGEVDILIGTHGSCRRTSLRGPGAAGRRRGAALRRRAQGADQVAAQARSTC